MHNDDDCHTVCGSGVAKTHPQFEELYTHIWTTVRDKQGAFEASEDEGNTGVQVGVQLH